MSISNVDTLKFIRQEISFEYTLLNSRISWFTTCQGFLIAAYTLSLTSKAIYAAGWLQWIIPTLGVCLSFFVFRGIDCAYKTIDIWRTKQHNLVSTSPAKEELQSIVSDRFTTHPEDDSIHHNSTHLARILPFIFILFWSLFVAFNYLKPIIH